MTPSKLERDFLEFHLKNPRVYRLLVETGRERLAKGESKLSIKHLIEDARWDHKVKTNVPSTHEAYRINCHHSAFYARLIPLAHPEFEGKFSHRKMATEPSFCAEGASLPAIPLN